MMNSLYRSIAAFHQREQNWVRPICLAVMVSLLVVLLLLLIGCGSSQGAQPGGSSATPVQGTAEVAMKNRQFVPKEITITAGTTVVWTNEDSYSHTVTSGTRGNPTGLFDTEVQAGGTFQYTFDNPGTYPYYCKIHPGMDGTVVVQ
jgi:plastocyanin